ncbi:thioredoxin family protein [Natronocalculus amylovorans]|uniref:Thioredoxin family protein n=1 Tax=Natronocalculus amylovorans TaxID=2917812 RepID=A0AAE3FZ82_9EURY|nr:thioredoxin family protein [Natronocalculus amylovorans]MCL9818041.1 thioredoxin family protein [Natronocalculus amylovorans]NUE03966.1 thioredoxin family protein [Halorubraceae archaeon YAN]
MTADLTTVDTSKPIEFDGSDDLSNVVADAGVVLVDFYADWCGPCKMMEPTVDAIAQNTAATVLKVDVDRFNGVAGQYGVRGIPTLGLFVDGELVEKLVGVQSEDQLASLIGRYNQ